MAIDVKLKDRLLRLVELSRRGIGGEKENAQVILDRLLKANNISMAEFDFEIGETPERRQFTFSGVMGHGLLVQVAAMVLDAQGGSLSYGKRAKNTLVFLCTRSQEVEIKVAYSIFRKDLNEHLDDMFHAFIYKNRIFPPTPPAAPKESKHTERDQRIREMMRAVDRSQITKQLERK